MPPIAVHFALGALAAWFVARRLPRAEDRGVAALGLVAGAVMVDADLLASSAAYLASCVDACSVEPGKLVHRTLTHAFPFTIALALAGVGLLARRRRWGVFLLAFAASDTVLHILPDAFYLVDVKFLTPFTLDGYHFGAFRKEALSDAVNNVINGVDFMAESLAWLWVWGASVAYGRENRFTRLLPWFATANFTLYGILTPAFATTATYDEFLVIIYYPGVLNIVISTILVPVLARGVIEAFGEGKAPPLRRPTIDPRTSHVGRDSPR